MTLADIARQCPPGSIALAGSLIYLVVHAHLNTRNTRALIHQGAAARITALRLGMMEADRSAAWFEGATGRPATPKDVRALQFNLACATAIDALEEHYLQHRAGLISDESFARNAAFLGGLLGEPGVRRFWREQRPTTARVAPRFCAFVDSLCESGPAVTAPSRARAAARFAPAATAPMGEPAAPGAGSQTPWP